MSFNIWINSHPIWRGRCSEVREYLILSGNDTVKLIKMKINTGEPAIMVLNKTNTKEKYLLIFNQSFNSHIELFQFIQRD